MGTSPAGGDEGPSPETGAGIRPATMRLAGDRPLPVKSSTERRRILRRPASGSLMPDSRDWRVLGARASRPQRAEGPIGCPCGRDARAPRFATGVWFRLRRVGANGEWPPDLRPPAVVPAGSRRMGAWWMAASRRRTAGSASGRTTAQVPTRHAPGRCVPGRSSDDAGGRAHGAKSGRLRPDTRLDVPDRISSAVRRRNPSCPRAWWRPLDCGRRLPAPGCPP